MINLPPQKHIESHERDYKFNHKRQEINKTKISVYFDKVHLNKGFISKTD